MRFAYKVAMGVLLAAALPATAAAPDRMSDAEAAAVQLALNRGVLIYAYDQAAWHGTDDMVTKIPNAPDTVGGWIVDGPSDAPEIVFYDRNATDPHAVYTARFKDGKLESSRVLTAADDRTLSPVRKALIAAKGAAAEALEAAKTLQCKEQPFNTVVLPGIGAEPVLVYFLSPQTSKTAIPMGGHYRVEVAANGKAKLRPFTKSCLELEFGEPGKKPEALAVSHFLDPTPTEVHVFSSLAAHLPIYVGTREGGRIWAVEGPRIRLLDKSKAAKPRSR
ncbi:MAG TPA: hypothetical protein VGC35_05425 [Allosphingosinicella sp.]|jgi:hypothetical protein